MEVKVESKQEKKKESWKPVWYVWQWLTLKQYLWVAK